MTHSPFKYFTKQFYFINLNTGTVAFKIYMNLMSSKVT
jgi:hypothetical protein